MRISKTLISPIVIIILTVLLAFVCLDANANANANNQEEDADCFPNLTHVNMCAHADQIVEAWSVGLPRTIGNTTTIRVQASGAIVSIHMVLIYTESDIASTAVSKGMTVAEVQGNWSTIMSDVVTESGCTKPLFIAFVGLGGIYEYNYYYQDGGLFATIIQRECPEDLE